MTSIREAEDLVQKAERGEWSLECDGKVLELMQNVANVSVWKLYDFQFVLYFISFIYRKLKLEVLQLKVI